MKTEVMEQNKLIAEFDGLQKFRGDWIHSGGFYSDRQLKYHTSWAWLMPVVEKIENKTDFIVIISGDCCQIESCYGENSEKFNPFLIDEPAASKIQATYQAVVQFIKWFNSNAPHP